MLSVLRFLGKIDLVQFTVQHKTLFLSCDAEPTSVFVVLVFASKCQRSARVMVCTFCLIKIVLFHDFFRSILNPFIIPWWRHAPLRVRQNLHLIVTGEPLPPNDLENLPPPRRFRLPRLPRLRMPNFFRFGNRPRRQRPRPFFNRP